MQSQAVSFPATVTITAHGARLTGERVYLRPHSTTAPAPCWKVTKVDGDVAMMRVGQHFAVEQKADRIKLLSGGWLAGSCAVDCFGSHVDTAVVTHSLKVADLAAALREHGLEEVDAESGSSGLGARFWVEDKAIRVSARGTGTLIGSARFDADGVTVRGEPKHSLEECLVALYVIAPRD